MPKRCFRLPWAISFAPSSPLKGSRLGARPIRPVHHDALRGIRQEDLPGHRFRRGSHRRRHPVHALLSRADPRRHLARKSFAGHRLQAISSQTIYSLADGGLFSVKIGSSLAKNIRSSNQTSSSPPSPRRQGFWAAPACCCCNLALAIRDLQLLRAKATSAPSWPWAPRSSSCCRPSSSSARASSPDRHHAALHPARADRPCSPASSSACCCARATGAPALVNSRRHVAHGAVGSHAATRNPACSDALRFENA